MCTENAITNALEEVDIMVDIRSIRDIDADVIKLKEELLDAGGVCYVRAKKLRKRINDVEADIQTLLNCEKSNAYDIANIIDKVDELEENVLKISKYTRDFIEECRDVIINLDKDVRKLL